MTAHTPEKDEISSTESAEAEPVNVEEFIAGTPSNKREMKRMIVQSHRVEFRGPIPPPETLAKYQDVDSEIPRQIMSMAQGRQDYIHNAHKRDQETRNTLQQRGQLLSFIVAIIALLGGIGLGVGLVSIGQIWPGVVLSLGALVHTALIFVKGEILFRFYDSGKRRRK